MESLQFGISKNYAKMAPKTEPILCSKRIDIKIIDKLIMKNGRFFVIVSKKNMSNWHDSKFTSFPKHGCVNLLGDINDNL